jgi:hypothetical protein
MRPARWSIKATRRRNDERDMFMMSSTKLRDVFEDFKH